MERTWSKRTEELIEYALVEDLGDGDVTTAATVPSETQSSAYIYSKAEGVLAGVDVAMKVFHKVDSELKTNNFYQDGDMIHHGHKICEISGPVSSILMAERTALNFLGRMTGIATKTAQYVKAVNGLHAKILDTRKTMPTMRHLDKYAVRVGGGSNHRFGLFDMVLIKDNHIAIAGGIRIAVENVVNMLEEQNLSLKIEVECKSYEDVLEAIYTQVDIIMLDNMEIGELEKSVHTVRDSINEHGRRIRVEASGNVDINSVREIAETGVDYISLGSLTHSVTNHDYSLLFDEL